MLSMAIISLFGCYDMNTLSVKPSTTTITYGRDNASAEKDAKNDVLTDSEKESWTIKQVFKWEQIMERMIISIIAAALLGLGAWNLNQTFNLSIEIESIKGKIEVIEKGTKQLRNMIAKDRQKDKKKKKNN